MSLSNEQSKQIMLNMFPKRQSQSQPQPQYQQPRFQYPQYPTAMFDQMDGYNKISTNIKKWYIAIIISIFAVFLLSSFSLNFIDEFCAKQNIEAFDYKGDPKTMLTSVLFLFLFAFSRIVLMLL
jgi:hypothetical protein